VVINRGLIRDFLNTGGFECPDPPVSSKPVAIWLFRVVPPFLTVVAYFDRLTPAFAGVLNFKIRIVTSLLILTALMYYSIRIVSAKHTNCKLSLHAESTHYSFPKTERLLAKLLTPVLLVTLLFSAVAIRNFLGWRGSIQGKLISADGAPLQEYAVDLLNLDNISVTTHAATTDNRGIFVIDLLPSGGAPAYLLATSPDGRCSKVQSISKSSFEVLYDNGKKDPERPQNTIKVSTNCSHQ
jgi:hypothetical protein